MSAAMEMCAPVPAPAPERRPSTPPPQSRSDSPPRLSAGPPLPSPAELALSGTPIAPPPVLAPVPIRPAPSESLPENLQCIVLPSPFFYPDLSGRKIRSLQLQNFAVLGSSIETVSDILSVPVDQILVVASEHSQVRCVRRGARRCSLCHERRGHRCRPTCTSGPSCRS